MGTYYAYSFWWWTPSLFALALMFLQHYATELNHVLIAGVDETTLRKWCWLYVSRLAYLKQLIILGITLLVEDRTLTFYK